MLRPWRGGGGALAYETGWDARQKFWLKPLKETDLGMAPKRDHVKTQTIYVYFYIF